MASNRAPVRRPLGSPSALDRKTSRGVAAKVLGLRQPGGWKVVELFEREARVLASLPARG